MKQTLLNNNLLPQLRNLVIKKFSNSQDNNRPGSAVIGIVVAGAGFIFFILAIVIYVFYKFIAIAKGAAFVFAPALALSGALLGADVSSTQPITVPTATKIECSGAKIPQNYLPWIKQAAAQYLNGDEAKLVAVISFESDFNPVDISNTGAVGLGQFIQPTAAGLQAKGFFKGSTITKVPRAGSSITPAEKRAFLKNYPFSGRLNPEASIMATAYFLKGALKDNHNDFRLAYAIGYNGEPGERKFQNADRMMAIYNKITRDGGCKALKQKPGQLGEAINQSLPKK